MYGDNILTMPCVAQDSQGQHDIGKCASEAGRRPPCSFWPHEARSEILGVQRLDLFGNFQMEFG